MAAAEPGDSTMFDVRSNPNGGCRQNDFSKAHKNGADVRLCIQVTFGETGRSSNPHLRRSAHRGGPSAFSNFYKL